MMDSTTIATEENEDLESGQEQETMSDGDETGEKRSGTRICRSDNHHRQSNSGCDRWELTNKDHTRKSVR